MRYPFVLFDLDHTLFDSDLSELEAFAAALARSGVVSDGDLLSTYQGVNVPLWSALERGEISLERLRVKRFEDLSDVAELDIDARVVADDFSELLGECGGLIDGALQVLAELAGVVEVGLVTNGVSQTQRSRLALWNLEACFSAVVVSGEFGFAKPGPEIFDECLRQLGGPPRDQVVMVGDSLTSDMRGATNSGIAACWFNPGSRTRPPDAPVVHEISHLSELLDIVHG